MQTGIFDVEHSGYQSVSKFPLIIYFFFCIFKNLDMTDPV